MPFIVVQGGRGITPHDLFPIDFRLDRDVLSNWKAERIVGVGQAKSVNGSVVSEGDLLDQREFSPFDWVQHFSGNSWGVNRARVKKERLREMARMRCRGWYDIYLGSRGKRSLRRRQPAALRPL